MSDFKIFTDSSCDLPQDVADSIGVEALPLKFKIDNKEYANYLDHRDYPIKDFYAAMKAGALSTTSLVNTYEQIESATPYLEKGIDILIISFSSALSGTYEAAVEAVKYLKSKFPNRKIAVIDSRCASLGQGLLVYLTAKKQAEGATFEEALQFAENTKLKVNHWFTVTDIAHLRRGGRVSKAASIIAQTLNIKPVMRMDDAGRLVPFSKVNGRKKSLRALVDKMIECAPPQTDTFFLSHGDDLEAAKYVSDMIKEQFSIKTSVINHVGPVIGSHTGQGVIALFFVAAHR